MKNNIELLDRLHISICTIEDHILQHTVTQNSKNGEYLRCLIESAINSLSMAYNEVVNIEELDETNNI